MKKVLLSVGLLLLCTVTKAQDLSVTEIQTLKDSLISVNNSLSYYEGLERKQNGLCYTCHSDYSDKIKYLADLSGHIIYTLNEGERLRKWRQDQQIKEQQDSMKEAAYKQTQPNFDSLKPIADKWSIAKHGSGNCKFNTKIKTLQSYVVTKHTVTDLEKSFCSWQYFADGYFKETYNWNSKTKADDIPEFEVYYTNDGNDITIEFDLKERLKFIEFVTTEYNLEDHIMPEIKALGYKLNKTGTRLAHALTAKLTGQSIDAPDREWYFSRSDKKSFVHIEFIGNKRYRINVSGNY